MFISLLERPQSSTIAFCGCGKADVRGWRHLKQDVISEKGWGGNGKTDSIYFQGVHTPVNLGSSSRYSFNLYTGCSYLLHVEIIWSSVGVGAGQWKECVFAGDRRYGREDGRTQGGPVLQERRLLNKVAWFNRGSRRRPALGDCKERGIRAKFAAGTKCHRSTD